MPARPQHTVIEAARPWAPFDLREILRYRDMLYFRVISAYKAEHRQTVLSYLWAVIDPILKIAFCTIVFSKVAKLSTGATPYLVFNAAGVVSWSFLGACLTGSIFSLSGEVVLLQKVYFPRIFIPLVPCLALLPNLLLNLLLTVGLLWWRGFPPTWSILMVVPLVGIMLLLASGVGLLLSPYAFQFRDVRKLWSGLVQFLIYAVPVAYPLSMVPERYRDWYLLNPMAVLVEAFRRALLGQAMPWAWLGGALLITLAVLYVGASVFRSKESTIVDAA